MLQVWVVTASAIYRFLCCVDLTSKMLLNNNSNNNNNNNDNSKDLFASSIFTMALRAIEQKTIKTNKNVEIYQFITKNMTTKSVKGLR